MPIPLLVEHRSSRLRARHVVEALVQERAHQLHGLEVESGEGVDQPLPLADAELGRERAEDAASEPPRAPRTPSA